MGIQRWEVGDTLELWESDNGEFVSFTDHEQVVAELTKAHQDNLDSWLHQREEITRLRAELAAKSKQLDAVRDEMSNWGGPSSYLHSCCNEAVRELLGELNAAMGEGNGR